MAKRHDHSQLRAQLAQQQRRPEQIRADVAADADPRADLVAEIAAREPEPQLNTLIARDRETYAQISALGARDPESGAGDGNPSGFGAAVAGEANSDQAPVGGQLSLKGALADLKFVLGQLETDESLPPRRRASLRRAVEREYKLTKAERDRRRSASTTFLFDDRYAPGPVAAILRDRQIPRLAGDERAARVARLLAATKPQKASRGQRALYAAAAAVVLLSLVGLYMSRGATPGLMIAAISILSMLYIAVPGHRSPYPRLDIGDAITLAHMIEEPRFTAELGEASTRSVQQAAASAFNSRGGEADLAPRTTRAARPGLRKPAPPVPQISQADRERRVTEVHAAVAELDTEWLEYSLDTNAWFLSKPQLRNDNDPVIAAYRQAQAELRDLTEDLTSLSTDTEIAAAQQAARRALTAWGDANTHALKIGVSDLSPSEEAALKQLHGLVNTLNDRSTPREMWAELKSAIIRNMDKLIVTSFDLNVIADLPVIAGESRLRALPAARGDNQQ